MAHPFENDFCNYTTIIENNFFRIITILRICINMMFLNQNSSAMKASGAGSFLSVAQRMEQDANPFVIPGNDLFLCIHESNKKRHIL
jgi:hypothetical protein